MGIKGALRILRTGFMWAPVGSGGVDLEKWELGMVTLLTKTMPCSHFQPS